MFEFVAGLFTAYVLSWPALVLLFIVGIYFEHTGSRKSALAAGIGVMAISYFYFDVELKDIAVAALGYLVIGVIWSFIRYRKYVKTQVEFIKTSVQEKNKREYALRLAPSNNLDRISSWIIVWPISLIENLLGDIIEAIQGLITRVFKGVYYKIYTKLTAGLLDEPVKPAKVDV